MTDKLKTMQKTLSTTGVESPLELLVEVTFENKTPSAVGAQKYKGLYYSFEEIEVTMSGHTIATINKHELTPRQTRDMDLIIKDFIATNEAEILSEILEDVFEQ
jgi:hypothetical protein